VVEVGAVAPEQCRYIVSLDEVWVPIRCDLSLPSRIHRRMVSGFLPAKRAASGTVMGMSSTTTLSR
jgi:hypothetical protein